MRLVWAPFAVVFCWTCRSALVGFALWRVRISNRDFYGGADYPEDCDVGRRNRCRNCWHMIGLIGIRAYSDAKVIYAHFSTSVVRQPVYGGLIVRVYGMASCSGNLWLRRAGPSRGRKTCARYGHCVVLMGPMLRYSEQVLGPLARYGLALLPTNPPFCGHYRQGWLVFVIVARILGTSDPSQFSASRAALFIVCGKCRIMTQSKERSQKNRLCFGVLRWLALAIL